MMQRRPQPKPFSQPERDEAIRPRTLIIGTCVVCALILIMAPRPLTERPAEADHRTDTAADSDSAQEGGARWRHRAPPSSRTLPRSIPSAVETLAVNPHPGQKSLANELIVKLKPDATAIDDIATSVDAKVTGSMDKLHAYRLQFTNGPATTAAREQLAANPEVESLDSNYSIVRPPAGGEITSTSESQTRLTVKPGDSGGKLVVGLIDTAVQVEASGLDQSFFLPPVLVAGESSTDAASLAHGTSMAETILQGLSAAETGNSSTSVRILSIDVYGQSETTTTYQVAEGIVKAVEGGATIINLSLGTEGDSGLLKQVIEDAHAQGIVFVGAAGNEAATTATYPAAYSEVVAVTATDNQGNLASYANYGNFVDIAAPGTVIVSYNGQSYLVTGTSASTALVTGAAAGLSEVTGASGDRLEATVRKGLSLQ
jgi:hypothetical protein